MKTFIDILLLSLAGWLAALKLLLPLAPLPIPLPLSSEPVAESNADQTADQPAPPCSEHSITTPTPCELECQKLRAENQAATTAREFAEAAAKVLQSQLDEARAALAKATEAPPVAEPPATPPSPAPSGLTHTDLASALAESKLTGLPCVIMLTTEWCGPCKQFEHQVLADSAVTTWMKSGVIFALVDAERHPADAAQFSFREYPAIFEFMPGGTVNHITPAVDRAGNFLPVSWLNTLKNLTK